MLANLAKVESLLFVSGAEGISLQQLTDCTGMMKPAVKEQILLLQKKYENDDECSLEIISTKERYRIATKKKFATLLQHFFEEPNITALSRASLETLAIIAYYQPVTRIRIEEVRGVQSSGPLHKLLAFNLISEKGRLDAPGKPILYETTETFLDYFNLKSLADLPQLPEKNEVQLETDDQNLMELFDEALQDEDQKKEGA
ncbi:segregation and condensation protein B [Liquorilactobacillus sucicola DSM 21376 = JCM 15457]|uniref:Segregation and condensation protein B n=1 Tax=Liquorilactobacillus sucicola DSM 21376 = JCM 15457 TaxID=1423806 RepID=A0A023CVE6_9LACO|nr:SMC-Scp complex subunit ScpB [Liquorilactobacillus sucicola]KRN05437.1 segregation and condensation protein B [Liquorilactobacillus sucicola DSM 21376 = JCM 15457]GAJ25515.1 segregation and condensation protein B [Liquorilactobacillus sucicola DSM 21376 = JCM 15457]